VIYELAKLCKNQSGIANLRPGHGWGPSTEGAAAEGDIRSACTSRECRLCRKKDSHRFGSIITHSHRPLASQNAAFSFFLSFVCRHANACPAASRLALFPSFPASRTKLLPSTVSTTAQRTTSTAVTSPTLKATRSIRIARDIGPAKRYHSVVAIAVAHYPASNIRGDVRLSPIALPRTSNDGAVSRQRPKPKRVIADGGIDEGKLTVIVVQLAYPDYA
jgi:hypothetical protein